MVTTAVTGLNFVFRWISGILLGGILVLMLLQIVLRTFQGRGFSWGNELATFFMVWAVCLGLAVAFFERTHLGVEFIVSRLGRTRRMVEAVAALVTVFFLGVLVYYGWSMVESGMRRSSPGLGLPMGYVYLALPVAGVIGILNIVVAIFIKKQPESRIEDEIEVELELAEEGIALGRQDLGVEPAHEAREEDLDDPGTEEKGRTS